MIGRIERVPLREVWKHEALDFTTWLQENIEVLNESIDLNLSNAEREKEAGAFSVDLVAEDDNGNPVVIENQLAKSYHDHLGKLITYLTAIEAKAAIWIVARPRQEHINAISWLNESSSASFYLLKVEAIRIGDSKPAPLLTLIVGPSEEAQIVGGKKKEMAERHRIRYEFWSQLLENAKTKTNLFANRSPGKDSWTSAGAGKAGITYLMVTTQHEAAVELYIDRGKDSDEENRAIFDQIEASKERVEQAFGGELEWQSLEGRRACRIKKKINVGGYRDDEETWPEIHNAMIDAMIRLEKALSPHIKRLKI